MLESGLIVSEKTLAEERTDWAEDRTLLANERTFAGWMRTGLANLAIAIGLQAVFGAMQPTWVARAAATVFVVVSLLIFWAAWRNATKMTARLDCHVAEPVTQSHFKSIAGFMAFGSIVTGVILWLV